VLTRKTKNTWNTSGNVRNCLRYYYYYYYYYYYLVFLHPCAL